VSDFLTRLAGRALQQTPVLEPLLAAWTAPLIDDVEPEQDPVLPAPATTLPVRAPATKRASSLSRSRDSWVAQRSPEPATEAPTSVPAAETPARPPAPALKHSVPLRARRG
jgi:hypothetical protein